MTDEEAVLAAAARIIEAETDAEFSEILDELRPYIERWAVLYRECIEIGLTPALAEHYVKLLMGEEIQT